MARSDLVRRAQNHSVNAVANVLVQNAEGMNSTQLLKLSNAILNKDFTANSVADTLGQQVCWGMDSTQVVTSLSTAILDKTAAKGIASADMNNKIAAVVNEDV